MTNSSHASVPFHPKATTPSFMRYIIAMHDTGSFSAAADLAAVSQPTLSAAIRSWEKSMGVILFERHARGVRPTAIGEKIITAAREALAAMEALEQITETQEAPFYDPLKLGMIPTVGPYCMPYLHQALKLAYPRAQMQPIEGKTSLLLDMLDKGQLDLAILALRPEITNKFHIAQLYQEPFLLAMPQSHPQANRKRIKVNDLDLNELMLLDEGHCMRDQALEICKVHRESQTDQYRATSIETLRQLVISDFGTTLIPSLASDRKTKGIKYCELSPQPKRDIVFIWRESDPKAEAYEALAKSIKSCVPQELVKV